MYIYECNFPLDCHIVTSTPSLDFLHIIMKFTLTVVLAALVNVLAVGYVRHILRA